MDFKAHKDPSEAKVYSFTWAEATDASPITDKAVRVVKDGLTETSTPVLDEDSDLTISAEEIAENEVRFVVTGGTIGSDYQIECEATFQDGMILNRESTLKVRNL